ncbi:hypothetical protein BP6252_03399 [Coleophoma cylindrospora]|uniref:DUF6594 domain-containing protein n=1 Tax=Coleophoma cylindrospora TaxID=1849047 RepID=A0A3D8S7J7_9HELO|nr:hypothetical protein BP6252_03399 [Coleophoma cylindrospora]
MDATNPIPDIEKGLVSPGSTTINTFSSTASTLPPKQASFWGRLRQWRSCATQEIDITRQPYIRKLETKHRGYRSLATFLDSDENFMLYRRFGYLHSRMLLKKQDELRELEFELDECDDDDIEKGTLERRRCLMSREFDEAAARKAPAEVRTRTKILNEIEQKLESYGKI